MLGVCSRHCDCTHHTGNHGQRIADADHEGAVVVGAVWTDEVEGSGVQQRLHDGLTIG